ncbi:hypothetical protein CI088_15970 [Enterococcus plantarum]|uniref:Lipoprotein n=1 Tax=Enterococcus plantarum TaxID=1077675 RepID=A0A2W4B2T0_9ENTE|nr:hypothetical protein [Enterococcus plantarum]PZL70145.1 hypothetical protein CI088_15970 [Enterococcus plantarum]
MKKMFNLGMVLFCGFTLVACGSSKVSNSDTSTTENKIEEKESSSSNDETSTSKIKIKSSPDKYTHYVKSYVGRNAATCGSKRLSGEMMDSYGEESLPIIFVSETGELVNSENAKDYVVTSQNPEPNTEIKLTYAKDEDGKEYDSLVESSSITEIELTVKSVEKK